MPPLAAEDPNVGAWPVLRQSEYAGDRYTQRFNSFIIDTFAGQLRSTLKCTVCKNESITFDPFWDLYVYVFTRTSYIGDGNVFAAVAIKQRLLPAPLQSNILFLCVRACVCACARACFILRVLCRYYVLS